MPSQDPARSLLFLYCSASAPIPGTRRQSYCTQNCFSPTGPRAFGMHNESAQAWTRTSRVGRRRFVIFPEEQSLYIPMCYAPTRVLPHSSPQRVHDGRDNSRSCVRICIVRAEACGGLVRDDTRALRGSKMRPNSSTRATNCGYWCRAAKKPWPLWVQIEPVQKSAMTS